MIILNTKPTVDDPVFWGYFTVWINLPDIFGYVGDDDYIDVEMYHQNTDNENRLLQQLNEVLKDETENTSTSVGTCKEIDV